MPVRSIPTEAMLALYEPEYTDADSLRQFHYLVDSGNNEWGLMRLLPVGSTGEVESIVPIFLNFPAATLVPPFSDFFLAVSEHYRIHSLHLHPNVVLVLAIFSHLCEGFIGVRPSLELFQYFFALRPNSGN